MVIRKMENYNIFLSKPGSFVNALFIHWQVKLETFSAYIYSYRKKIVVADTTDIFILKILKSLFAKIT